MAWSANVLKSDGHLLTKFVDRDLRACFATKSPASERAMLHAPQYVILSSKAKCYQCHQETPVVAIALPPQALEGGDADQHDHGWLNAVDVAELPVSVAAHLRQVPGGLNYIGSTSASPPDIATS